MSNYVVIGEDEFASRIAQELATSFIQVSPTIFPDTELKTRLSAEALKTIRTKTPLVVMRAKRYHPNPNDCVLKTLLIADTLSRYGVQDKDLLLPYMFYARQDGERLPGESNSLSKVAEMYEEVGFSNLISVNSHLYGKPKTLQHFFSEIHIYDISAAKVFAQHLSSQKLQNPFIVGPGSGPEKMAIELSDCLECGYECLPKTRDPDTGRVDMDPPTSDLRDKDIIIYDDIASSGGTTEMAYRLAEAKSPRSISIALAHLWTTRGINRLNVLGSHELITTNSFITEHAENPFTELSLVPIIVRALTQLT
jgi:ribose-phosphate pyrophosphokinase